MPEARWRLVSVNASPPADVAGAVPSTAQYPHRPRQHDRSGTSDRETECLDRQVERHAPGTSICHGVVALSEESVSVACVPRGTRRTRIHSLPKRRTRSTKEESVAESTKRFRPGRSGTVGTNLIGAASDVHSPEGLPVTVTLNAPPSTTRRIDCRTWNHGHRTVTRDHAAKLTGSHHARSTVHNTEKNDRPNGIGMPSSTTLGPRDATIAAFLSRWPYALSSRVAS